MKSLSHTPPELMVEAKGGQKPSVLVVSRADREEVAVDNDDLIALSIASGEDSNTAVFGDPEA